MTTDPDILAQPEKDWNYRRDNMEAGCGFCGCYWNWDDMEDERLCNYCSWYGHGDGEYVQAGRDVPDLI